jgi:hypothetical protein
MTQVKFGCLTGIAALVLATGTAHATSIAQLCDLDLRSA